MKKIFLLLTLLLTLKSYSQQITPGWYIVESKAQYCNYTEYSETKTAIENGEVLPLDMPGYSLVKGEVLFVTSFENDIYSCFDPLGQMILVKGKMSLVKAPAGAGVGIITEGIEEIDGSIIGVGMFVWIVGQDISKGTIKIRLNEGAEKEIPKANIMLLTASLKREMSSLQFKDVE